MIYIWTGRKAEATISGQDASRVSAEKKVESKADTLREAEKPAPVCKRSASLVFNNNKNVALLQQIARTLILFYLRYL
jgi:hypothetical protein